MITLEGVSKRYVVDHQPRKWVLHDVSLRVPVPAGAGVAVVGARGAGKSTLLQLITGAEEPTQGRVHSTVRVSYPAKYQRNLQKMLTGRQNARFICRINGYVSDLEERLERIEAVAHLGPKFDKPVNDYSSSQKQQLSFALSWAFDFDVYVSDGFNFAGGTAFGSKAAADEQLQQRLRTSALVMAGQGAKGDGALKQWCSAGIWVHEGRAVWFDRVDDAIAAARTVQPAKEGRKKRDKKAQREASAPEALLPAMAGIKRMQNTLTVLSRGVLGDAPVVEPKNLPRLLRVAKDAGMELMTREEMLEQGVVPAADAVPILKVPLAGDGEAEYFDWKLQGVPAGSLASA